MKITDIIAYIDKGLAFANGLAPIVSALGIPGVGPAVKIATELADVAHNAAARIADGTLAATTEDEAALKALIVKLRALNDAEDAEALA